MTPGRGGTGSRGVRHRSGSLSAVLTLLVGIAATICSALAIADADQRTAEARFSQEAAHVSQDIQARLSETDGTLLTLCDVMASNPDMARPAFQRFARRLRSRGVALRDSGWAPRVARDDRAEFERTAVASGLQAFAIREPDAKHTLVPATERDVYYPIFFPDPVEIAPRVMGIDLSFEPVRRAAIAKSLATDAPAATPPMRLATVDRDFSGFMSFVPVAAPGGKAGDPPAGLIYGVFEIAPMLEAASAAAVHDPSLGLLFFDRDAGRRTLHWRPPSGDVGAAAEPSLAWALGKPHWEGDLRMADQRWGVVLVPEHGIGEGFWTRSALGILAAGASFSLMVAASILALGRKNGRLEAATSELRATAVEMASQRERLAHLASHDPLTGLANRARFNQDLEARLEARGPPYLTLLLLDLDGFKPINDTHGHPVGDEQRVGVGERLIRTASATACVARLGGDEFAIVDELEDGDVDDLCRRLGDALRQPFDVGGAQVGISVSIGVARATCAGRRPKELVKEADMALYAAKAAGRGTYRLADLHRADAA